MSTHSIMKWTYPSKTRDRHFYMRVIKESVKKVGSVCTAKLL